MDAINQDHPAISAPAPEQKVSSLAQLAIIIGHGVDAGTTIYALKQGAIEANPLLGSQPSTGKVLGVKAGAAAAQMFLQHLLGKRSPRAANALGYITGAMLGGVGAWNMSQANKAKK